MSQDFLGNGQQGPDVKRLLLAGALMTVVLMGYNLLFPPKPVAPAAKEEAKPVAVAQPAPVEPFPRADELPAGVVATSNLIPIVTREFNVDVKASGEEATLAA